MESMAEPGTVLISKNTYKIVYRFFVLEPLGKVEVKGKEKSQEAYKLLMAAGVETRLDAAKAKGLTKFVGRKNSMAALQECLEIWLDTPKIFF